MNYEVLKLNARVHSRNAENEKLTHEDGEFHISLFGGTHFKIFRNGKMLAEADLTDNAVRAMLGFLASKGRPTKKGKEEDSD